jgi:L-alanine-DL-glutamate epimerase-like enolase superfamily enzyme
VPVVAAVPNGLFSEYIQGIHDPMGQIFIDPIKARNGEVTPSNKPGFGLELNEEAIKKMNVKPSPEELRRSTKKGWRWPPYL